MKQIIPIRNMILVKPDPENETIGRLYIPEIAREKTLRGEIVATGPGKRDDYGNLKHTDVHVGQKVYYTKNYTNEVMHNGSEHLLMNEDRVLLIDERD